MLQITRRSSMAGEPREVVDGARFLHCGAEEAVRILPTAASLNSLRATCQPSLACQPKLARLVCWSTFHLRCCAATVDKSRVEQRLDVKDGGPDHSQLEPARALATRAGGTRARRLSLSLTPIVASDPNRSSWRARRGASRMRGSCGRCPTSPLRAEGRHS
jgi:hypothetical protein